MARKNYTLGNIVKMKKAHPCGTNSWEIVRVGVDIKIKCQGCNRIVMLARSDFEKRLIKVLE
ncbi:MAG TPA: DUF951 domain-containing protein [Syntrophomonadaceae bacterium]|nr:DUF951 domain-containing protein [Syntrophomonadaceae bacterium]